MIKYYDDGFKVDTEINIDKYLFLPEKDKTGIHEISLSRLIELFKDEKFIPYNQYLRTTNWKNRRVDILNRDKFRCRKCKGFQTETIKDAELRWSQVKQIDYLTSKGTTVSCKIESPEGKPDKSYSLEIHHKKYFINRLPWDYCDSDLITLCNYCHRREHLNNDIPLYNEYRELLKDFKVCARCSGVGFLPEYPHVQNGICFTCRGLGCDVLLINKQLL